MSISKKKLVKIINSYIDNEETSEEIATDILRYLKLKEQKK